MPELCPIKAYLDVVAEQGEEGELLQEGAEICGILAASSLLTHPLPLLEFLLQAGQVAACYSG